MRWAKPTSIARQQLLWGAGVVVITLSLLIMHQLSLNHTAADPTADGMQVSSIGSTHLDHHDRVAIEDDHTHLLPLVADGQPAHDNGACLACNGDHAMVLTCLVALILLAVGWLLRRPAEWRGVRLPHVVPLLLGPDQGRMPPPLTLVELSVSRT